uniref:Calciumbinding atopyrelated autoantigenlike protein putative n=1 Tax=Albugo laibachii Nc14 TaxID=890382 RepID=F0VYT3_9STRA|nr:calciumbinding atopyrelated autoantigenlike protein putative [Albugo laibachii Nc14]|eukprot:CCA13948.1 calciumbinding atopyrelated autoantigenlike protein putative [Albugo laibachii Nc14]
MQIRRHHEILASMSMCGVTSYFWRRNDAIADCDTASLIPSTSFSELYHQRYERIIGNYENRIRTFSAPERVFDYFASIRVKKKSYMTREDLAFAMTPYHPLTKPYALHKKSSSELVKVYHQQVKKLFSSQKSGWLSDTKEQIQAFYAFCDQHRISYETHVSFLKQLKFDPAEVLSLLRNHGIDSSSLATLGSSFWSVIDADGDGLISYTEFMFFNILLSISPRQVELAFKMFDIDRNGLLSQREFSQVVELLRMRTPSGRQDRSFHPTEGAMFKHFFGQFGTRSLSFQEFRAFQQQLKTEIFRLQISFHQELDVPPSSYDMDQDNELSPEEFGMFLISHVKQSEMDMWVDRVRWKLHDIQGGVSEKDFLSFLLFLDHLEELHIAFQLVMDQNGVNKEQFQRASRAANRKHARDQILTPLQLDILFALFDTNDDGLLDMNEFLMVMAKRKDGGFNSKRDTGALDFIAQLIGCIKAA